MFFMFVQLAIISIFKSYPTVGDVALYMAFLPVWSHLYRCKFFVFDCFFSGMRKGLSNNSSPLSQTTLVSAGSRGLLGLSGRKLDFW